MTKHQNTIKRLTLTRETLRTLTPNELRLVAGGAGIRTVGPTVSGGC